MEKKDSFSIALVLYAALAMILGTVVICNSDSDNDSLSHIGWPTIISGSLILISFITAIAGYFYNPNGRKSARVKELEETIKKLKEEKNPAEKDKSGKDTNEQEAKEKAHKELRLHEEKMAIIKSLGANLNKENIDKIQEIYNMLQEKYKD